MQIIRLMAWLMAWAVATVAVCVGGVAAALWCAQAARSVPDGPLPAQASDDHENRENREDASPQPAGGQLADGAEAYERHVTEVEGDQNSPVIHTDLTDTAAHRNT